MEQITVVRDPRIDPQPGDVIRDVNGDWIVTRRSLNGVDFSPQKGNKHPSGVVSIDQWREASKGKEVIKRG